MLRKGRSRQGPGEFVDGEWRMQPRRPTRPRVSSCLFCFRPFLFESSISRSLIRRLQSLTSRAMQSIKAIHTTLSIKSAIRHLIIHHQRRFQTPTLTPHTNNNVIIPQRPQTPRNLQQTSIPRHRTLASEKSPRQRTSGL